VGGYVDGARGEKKHSLQLPGETTNKNQSQKKNDTCKAARGRFGAGMGKDEKHANERGDGKKLIP